MSSSYHPQTDGSSERTRVRFQIMNSINASTGTSPFQLHLGRSPRIIPPLERPPPNDDPEEHRARSWLRRPPKPRKLTNTVFPNYPCASGIRSCSPPSIEGGNTCRKATIESPNSCQGSMDPNIFPTFHSSQLKLFHANDSILFPSREFPRPGPVVTANGQMETFIEKIVDEKRVGRGKRYLVRWVGFGADEDEWLPRRDLEDCEALDVWEQRTNSSWGGRV